MARNTSYTGSIDLISGVRPKNGGAFPLIDAADVQTFAAIVSLYSKEVEHSADNLQLLQKLFRRGTLTWQYLMAILDA